MNILPAIEEVLWCVFFDVWELGESVALYVTSFYIFFSLPLILFLLFIHPFYCPFEVSYFNPWGFAVCSQFLLPILLVAMGSCVRSGPWFQLD